jgi:DNA-binding NarL/FixJ family response regulator
MPDRTGLEVLKDLKILYPRLKVLILSIHPEDRYALRALKAGAAGYLTKDSAPEELVGAIERVLKGGRYVSQSIAEKLTDVAQGNLEGIALHELLSDREFEVLRLLGEGKSVSQIADELALSVKTVSTYRARICEKLRLESTADLIRYAVEYKIVD